MIVISGALVLVALVLLVVGITMRELPFVHGSIAVSLLAFVFLIIGVLQRRGEQFPVTDASARLAGGPGGPQESPTLLPRQGLTGAVGPAQPPAATPHEAVAAPASVPASTAASTAASRAELPEAGEERDGADGPVVLVVPGRPRYHVDGCRYLNGKEVEEIHVLDARDEGFSPCGVCRPDEVLAVQAHVRGGLGDSASGSATAAPDAPPSTPGAFGWADSYADDDVHDQPAALHRAQHLREETDDDVHDDLDHHEHDDLAYGGPGEHARDAHDVYARAAYADPAHEEPYGDGPYDGPYDAPYADSRHDVDDHDDDAGDRTDDQASAAAPSGPEGPHDGGQADDWAYEPDDLGHGQAADRERAGHRAPGEDHAGDVRTGTGGGSSAVDENVGAFALLGGGWPHDETDDHADHPDEDAHPGLAATALGQPASVQPGASPPQPDAEHQDDAPRAAQEQAQEQAQRGTATRQRRSGAAAGPSAGPAPAGRAGGRGSTRLGGPAPLGARDSVLVNRERGRYHRPDCRYVREATDAVVLTKSRANRQGYSACGVCRP